MAFLASIIKNRNIIKNTGHYKNILPGHYVSATNQSVRNFDAI
jgi:hypothetical protein